MTFRIHIAVGDRAPIYRQIVEQVRLAVARGELVPGDPLQSVRGLAETLVVNPNTVAKAYTELAREGVIESIHGRGTFVAHRRAVISEAERQRRFDAALDSFVHEAICLEYPAHEVSAALAARFRERSAKPGDQR